MVSKYACRKNPEEKRKGVASTIGGGKNEGNMIFLPRRTYLACVIDYERLFETMEAQVSQSKFSITLTFSLHILKIVGVV